LKIFHVRRNAGFVSIAVLKKHLMVQQSYKSYAENSPALITREDFLFIPVIPAEKYVFSGQDLNKKYSNLTYSIG
jgi:hypothetical protein